MKNSRKTSWILTIIILCLTTALALAQPPQRPQPDPLGGLKRALAEAGAPELSSQQATQLEALVKQFRDGLAGQQPDETVRNAENAYQAAILAGNLAAANAQATIIANTLASQTRTRLETSANYKIQAINILKANNQQLTALVQRFGTIGVYGLVSGLFGGGPGGRGPNGPPMGPGPGGPGFGPRRP